MRYSPFTSATEVADLVPNDASNERFFSALTGAVGESALHGAILLVGGRDSRALALRRAQAVVRFDRRPSKWSHAALIVRWSSEPAQSVGVEVTLDPSEPRQQVPERNGVTSFRLARYFDREQYPNLAVLTVGFEPPAAPTSDAESTLPSAAERRSHAIGTALTPMRERERYPLWDMLGTWARHVYLPYSTTNPLLDGLPLPCASLCEYAYEAAGVDLTPGATGNNNCPEVLYATAKHWAEGISNAQGAQVRLFSLTRDEHAVPLDVLDSGFDDLHAPTRDELGERARSPRASGKRGAGASTKQRAASKPAAPRRASTAHSAQPTRAVQAGVGQTKSGRKPV